MDNKAITEQITVIDNVQVFDGENVIKDKNVIINGSYIQAVGSKIPVAARIIDGHGKTLLSGLIDSHVHTDMDGLKQVVKFGVTTGLEMQGHWSAKKRKEISERNDLADLYT